MITVQLFPYSLLATEPAEVTGDNDEKWHKISLSIALILKTTQQVPTKNTNPTCTQYKYH